MHSLQSSQLLKSSNSQGYIQKSNKEELHEKEESFIKKENDIEIRSNKVEIHFSPNPEKDEDDFNQKFNEIEGEIFFSQEIQNDNKFDSKSIKSNSQMNYSDKGLFNAHEKYDIFDKAKENLLKIKDDIEQLNQYDYRHIKQKSKVLENDLEYEEISKKEIELDEYE